MNDIIEELLDLDMEPKPESLWWTSTHKHEDKRTLCVGDRGKLWDLAFCEVFDVLGYRFHRDGKGFQGAERRGPEKLVARRIHPPLTDSPNDNQVQASPKPCIQHGPEWQHQLALEWRLDQQGACVGRPDFTPHLQTSHEAGRNLGGLQNKNVAVHEGLLEEKGPAVAGGEKCE